MESEQKTGGAQMTATEGQEIGVCRSGKHRVINAIPFPLTPSSTSHIPPGAIKKWEGKKKRTKLDFDPNRLRNPRKGNTSGASIPKTTDGIKGSDVSSVSLSSSSPWHKPEIKTEMESHSTASVSIVENHTAAMFSLNTEMSQSVSEFKAPAKPNVNRSKLLGKRERVIEISPSLRLPVTAVPSRTGSSNSTPYGSGEPTEKNSAVSLLSASSSRTSLSDMTSLGLTFSEDDISTLSEQDSNQVATASNLTVAQAECEHLKDVLKLADADIAILVSAKQQLQLDFHHQEERVQVLSRYVFDVEDKNRNMENTIDHLETRFKEEKERSDSELGRCQGQILASKSEVAALQNSLDETMTDRDLKKLQIEHMERELATQGEKLKKYETEIQELRIKNTELESVLEDASAKGEGKESFIKLLTQEKNELMKKYLDKEGALNMLQITNKTLEAKIVDLHHAKESLDKKVEKHESCYREAESENLILSSRLQVASRENADLNAAVGRLHSDMEKVENSFARLRQQLLKKTHLAEQESMRKNDLAVQVKSLTSQVAKLDNVNAETRIRDKNVQIEQLLSMSKVSSIAKAKLEKRVEQLGEHIASNEISWVEGIEREKQASRLLREKEDLISQKSSEIASLSASLEKERLRLAEIAQTSELGEETLAQLKMKLVESDKKIERLTAENSSTCETVEKLQAELHTEKEFQKSNEVLHGEECRRMQLKIQDLNDEIDVLQKKLVSNTDELYAIKKDMVKPSNASEELHEGHSIQHLQLLSELQSARRELSKEKDALIEENSKLKAVIDTLKLEFQESQKMFEKDKKRLGESFEVHQALAKAEKDDLQAEAETLHERLKQIEKSKLQTEEELLVTKDHNNALSQKFGSLQFHKEQLAKDLEEKVKDNDTILSDNKMLKQELGMLKQEFSNLTEQLTSSVQEKQVQDKEKDLLRNAVIHQQQYCVSLQKHYEKWAKDVAKGMKAEVMRYKRHLLNINASQRESLNYPSPAQADRTAYYASHPYGNNLLYPKQDERQIKEESLVHSEEYEEELEATLTSVSGSSGSYEVHTGSGDTGSVDGSSTKRLRMVPESVSTQTYHDDEYVGPSHGMHGMRSASAQTFLSDEYSHSQADNHEIMSLGLDASTQTDHDDECVGSGHFVGRNQQRETVSLDASSQTDHDDEYVSLGQNCQKKSASLDASSQTHHDDEYVGPGQNSFAIDALVQEKMSLVEENNHQSDLIAELEERIQNWSMSDSATVADSSTQTLHDEDLLPLLSDTTTKLSPLLEDSSCQTEHDNEQVRNESAAELEQVFALKGASDRDVADLQQANAFLKSHIHELEKHLEDAKDSRSAMLEDSGTQTSHDEIPLCGVFSSSVRHEVSSTLLEDSSTQTDHDRDLAFQGTQDFVRLNNELKHTREEVGRLSLELQSAVAENKRLHATIIDCEEFFRNSNNTGSMQTSSDADNKSADAPCQKCIDEGLAETEPLRSKYLLQKGTSLEEDVGPYDPEIPSPMLILKKMESKKLKAYKKTVHLLKKKLECAEEKIANLQAEMNVLSANVSDSSSESMKGSSAFKSIQEELLEVKKAAFVQTEEVKRKAMMERKNFETKLSVILEKVSSLTNANQQLRTSLQSLQVKFTEKSRRYNIVLKEKGRYQMRSRRLQASLRSLAWITGSQDKMLGLSEDSLDVSDGSLISEDLTENNLASSQDPVDTQEQQPSAKSTVNLPVSVVEIEASLKDLQSEIVALAKQMQEHNTAVKQSKTQWTRLKEESRTLSSSQAATATLEPAVACEPKQLFKVV